VRFNEYGDIDVLEVVEVDRPIPGPGEVLVGVKAAGINPGEAMIRKGLVHDLRPATFPSGEGSDLAGVVEELGAGVAGFEVGDEVFGFTNNRASHADFVLVDADQLVHRPSNVSWEAAGALFVAGTAAFAAVRAAAVGPGDSVVVTGAAGGVGALTVQLATNAGATVVGLASEANHEWLAARGVIPLSYGDGVAARITAALGGKVDAFIDTSGADYVRIAVKPGIRPDRIDIVINFADAERYGAKTEGSSDAANTEVLAELADLVDQGLLEVPIAKVYPLADVRDAYQALDQRHTRGKIVLVP
jgi:NADPH:quinone reductase-like Zn-dependent oxidoreductase